MLYIAVCDDDKNDLNILTSMIDDILSRNNMAFDLIEFSSANMMIQELRQIDVAILDIAMDEMDGIDLGRKLKAKFPELRLIYTTSFAQYCIQVINEVHAFSFLCKPIEGCKLEEQLLQILEEIDYNKNFLEKSFYMVMDNTGKEYAVIKLKLKDIIYFESVKSTRRIKIVLEEIVYEFSYVMEKLVDELENLGFGINCRGCLVNFRHVVKIKGYSIHMDNGIVLHLSQKRVAKFKEMLNTFLHTTVVTRSFDK